MPCHWFNCHWLFLYLNSIMSSLADEVWCDSTGTHKEIEKLTKVELSSKSSEPWVCFLSIEEITHVKHGIKTSLRYIGNADNRLTDMKKKKKQYWIKSIVRQLRSKSHYCVLNEGMAFPPNLHCHFCDLPADLVKQNKLELIVSNCSPDKLQRLDWEINKLLAVSSGPN